MAKSKRVSKRQSKRRSSPINTAINLLISTLLNPLYLALTFSAYYLAVVKPSVVTAILTKLQSSPLFKEIATYLLARITQTIGALYLTIAILAFAPARYSFVGAVAVNLLVFFLLPPTSILEYCSLGLFILAFVKVRSTIKRVVIAFVAIVTVALGLWGHFIFFKDKTYLLAKQECELAKGTWRDNSCQ